MEKEKKLIFVCSPLRGEVNRNVKYVKELCLKVLEEGNVPFAPHLFFTQFLDDNIEEERMMGINAGLEYLKRCDNILIGDKYGISEGMKIEIELFNKLKNNA